MDSFSYYTIFVKFIGDKRVSGFLVEIIEKVFYALGVSDCCSTGIKGVFIGAANLFAVDLFTIQ